MSGSPFSYPAWDLVNATPIDGLPYTGVTFGAPLNQPGSFTGGIPLADPNIQQSFNWQRATQTTTTAVFIDLFGTLVWGGIIWTQQYDSSDPTRTLKIGATEFGSYFQSRIQAKDYGSTWTPANGGVAEDPMIVAQTVVQDALAKGSIFGGITLTLNPAGGEGGPQITPSYPGTSLQTIDSIVSILSQMGYSIGFDYTFDVSYIPGTQTPQIVMNIWYPRKGRTAVQSNIVLLAADCTYTYPVDGTQRATSITETGSGVGTIEPATASTTLPDVPRLERTFSRSQINDDGTLAQVTASDLFLNVWPAVAPTFTVPLLFTDEGIPPEAPLQLGTFDRGDNFIFRIDPVAGGGENTDPRFPNGHNFEWRINSWQCTVADKGRSTIVLNAGIPPGVFPPPQPPGT